MAPKAKLTLSVDEQTVGKAKSLGINISEVTEKILRSLVSRSSSERGPSKASQAYNKTAQKDQLIGMLQELLGSEYWEAVTSAKVQLVTSFGSEAVPTLIDSLRGFSPLDKEYDEIVEVIGMIGDPQALPYLTDMLDDDEAGESRYVIIEAMAKIGGRDALKTVVDSYLSGTWLRRQDFWLGIFGRFGKSAPEELARALTRTHPSQKVTATAPKDSLNPWWGRMDSTRVRLVVLIAKLGRDEALPMLKQSLGDPEADVRAQAAEELGELRDRDSVRILMDGLADEEFPVVVASLEALGAIGDTDALPAMIEFLEPNMGERSADWHVRKAAERAILLLGEDAIPALTAALRDSETGKRKRLANLVAKIGDK